MGAVNRLARRIADRPTGSIIRVSLGWLAIVLAVVVLLFTYAWIYVGWLRRHTDESTFFMSVQIVSWDAIITIVLGPPMLFLVTWIVARLIVRSETRR